MKKKLCIALASVVFCGVLVYALFYSRLPQEPEPLPEFDAPAVTDEGTAVEPITADTQKQNEIIIPPIPVEESKAPEAEEEVSDPETIIIEEEDETIITKDWESLREHEPGTVIRDPEEEPAAAAPVDNTPQGGDKTEINGETHMWVPGVGWVKMGSGSVGIEVHAPTKDTHHGY